MKKTIKILVMTMLAAMIMVIGSKTANAADNDLKLVELGISNMDKSLVYLGRCESGFSFIDFEEVTDLAISSSDESICTAELYTYRSDS